ncbi:hypothetical protein KY284_020063 [Solanum tuberosum]|nr:hypothetical protein KY284_020063 [Solanum tuberosum]
MDVNFTHMRHHLDNIQNTLSACSQKFSNTQARPDLAASLVDKCDVEEVAEHEIIFALNKVNLNTTEHSEVPYKMLEPHVEKSKVLPKLLNSRGSSSTSIPFPSSVISFGCVETLGPICWTPKMTWTTQETMHPRCSLKCPIRILTWKSNIQ